MNSASKSRGEPSRHGDRGGTGATSGEKTGSNLLEIQGPKRTWGGNPPPSASTASTQYDIGPGPTEPATSGSGWSDSTPFAPVPETVTPHGAAGGWGETPSSVSGWGEPAPTAAAAGWGDPHSTSSWGQETKTEHPPLAATEPFKRPRSPLFLDDLSLDGHDVSSSQSTWSPMSPNMLKYSGAMDSRATRKTYLDNLAKLKNAVLLSTEHSEVTRKLEMCHKIVAGYSQLDMDGCVPENENAAQELKLRVEVTISKLVNATLWPVGPPEIAQHTAISRQLQDIQGRLEALKDTFKSSTDQDSSLPADGNPLMAHNRNIIPEVNDDTSLLSRLERLEMCVPDVGSDILRLCDGVVQNVDARIEQNLVALRIQNSALEEGELRDHLDLNPGPVQGNVQGKLDKLADTFSSFVGQNIEVVDGPDNLAVELSKISVENDTLRSKNNQLDATYKALKSDLARVDDDVQRILSDIKSGKMTPATSVTQQMRRGIFEDILHDLEPIFLSFRQQFDFAMASGQEESLEYFMERFGLAIQMFELMYGNLERSRASK